MFLQYCKYHDSQGEVTWVVYLKFWTDRSQINYHYAIIVKQKKQGKKGFVCDDLFLHLQ